jgi:hypothetical protein
MLDICFREDEQRRLARNSAVNLSWLRKISLCLLKAEKISNGEEHPPPLTPGHEIIRISAQVFRRKLAM